MNDSDSKKILEDVANGSTTSKQAAKKLGVTISEIWALIDSKNIGRRELNKDELEYLQLLKWDQDKKDIFAVTTITSETLETLKDDIEKYTKEDYKKPEEKKIVEQSAFAGIFSDFGKSLGIIKEKKEEGFLSESEKAAKEEKEKSRKLKEFKEKGIKPDTYEENIVRQLTELDAAKSCFSIYDVFKKSKGMASFLSPFDDPDAIQRLRAKIAEVSTIRRLAESNKKS